MHYYFITGTSKGLGRVIAEKLLESTNNKVIGISRTRTIEHQNYSHETLDLGNIGKLKDSVHAIFGECIDAKIIVLINNAGMLGEVAKLGDLNDDNIQKTIEVNITAPAILMNGFLAKYKSYTCSKVIINITSGEAKRPIDGWSAYCASKAAINMLSLVGVQEDQLRKSDVSIFSIAPGVVDTDMQAEIRRVSRENFSMVQEFVDYKSKGILAKPEDVARKIIFLAEHAKKYSETIMSVGDI